MFPLFRCCMTEPSNINTSVPVNSTECSSNSSPNIIINDEYTDIPSFDMKQNILNNTVGIQNDFLFKNKIVINHHKHFTSSSNLNRNLMLSTESPSELNKTLKILFPYIQPHQKLSETSTQMYPVHSYPKIKSMRKELMDYVY